MPKKTAAQLQREIDAALAQPSEPSGSGASFRRAGTKVSIEPSPSGRGKGLMHKTRKYGVLMEDARVGPGAGWDVYDVRLPDGTETSAYGFDLRLAPSAIFREAIDKRKREAVKTKRSSSSGAGSKRLHATMKSDAEEDINVLSIDAWSDGEGGWTWNQWFKVGKISRSKLASLKTNAQILKYMRDEGYLKDASKGRVTVDDDQYNYVIVDKRNREPLFAIAYGEGQ